MNNLRNVCKPYIPVARLPLSTTRSATLIQIRVVSIAVQALHRNWRRYGWRMSSDNDVEMVRVLSLSTWNLTNFATLEVPDMRTCMCAHQEKHFILNVGQDCFVHWISPSSHEYDYFLSVAMDLFKRVHCFGFVWDLDAISMLSRSTLLLLFVTLSATCWTASMFTLVGFSSRYRSTRCLVLAVTNDTRV